MKEVKVSDVPGSVSAWPIAQAAKWIRLATKDAGLSARWFGFIGPRAEFQGHVTEPYDMRPNGRVYVWNSHRAIVLDDGDREWIIENMP